MYNQVAKHNHMINFDNKNKNYPLENVYSPKNVQSSIFHDFSKN